MTALVAVAVTAGLAVATRHGTAGMLAGVGAVQALLAPAWLLGTGVPGRRGGIVLGLATAAAADALLVADGRTSLAVLVGVLALAVPALLVHQLTRGVVRVTESLSGLGLLVTAQVALAGCLALARAPDGARLVSAVVVSAGAGLAVARLVDAAVPAPRFAGDVPYGLPAVLAAVAAGAVAGVLHVPGAERLGAAGGAALGAVVAGLAALLAVGVGYLERTDRRAAPAYLGVALPVALAAPAGYLLALTVAG